MFKKHISLLLSLLLLSAMACFAQSGVPQTIIIAQGASVKLKASSADAISYQWIKDGIPIANATSAIYTAAEVGSYTVISFNEGNCTSDISDPIIVKMNGLVMAADLMITKTSELRSLTTDDIFEYNLRVKNNGPNTANLVKVLDPLPKQLNFEQIVSPAVGAAYYSESNQTITWEILKLENGETADLKIRVKGNKAGFIKNTAWVTAAETDPRTGNNSSTDIKPIIGVEIPNVFTPNDDGKNDTFTITGLEFYATNTLTVLNRWGSTVYEKNGYTNDWKANGLSDATYFYILRVKTPALTWQEFRGYVTVMR